LKKRLQSYDSAPSDAIAGQLPVTADDLDNDARLLEKLAEIRESFLLRTRGELPGLCALLERMQAGDSMELAQLQNLVHRIHGSAATFDFAAISGSAGRVEHLAEILLGTSAASVIEAHDLRCLVECGRQLAYEIGAATTKRAEVLNRSELVPPGIPHTLPTV
jgi:HPt (histidine-containing phosphotransfer) domain-containing protein